MNRLEDTPIPRWRHTRTTLEQTPDHWVPPETSVAFFDALAAPSKELVWFEHSGHEAFVDEPEKFNSTMVEVVRRLAPLAPTAHLPARLPVSA